LESQSNSFSDATGRYAKSIFQIAVEKNILPEIEKNFFQVRTLLKNSIDFKKFVVNPTIQKQSRLSIIETISKKFNFNKYFINFLKLINEKGRFFFLEKIIRDFFSIVAESKGEVTADLIIANEISEIKKEEIKKELSLLYKKDIKLNFSVDESLISGSILKVGSKMIDNSAKSKFNRILNNI
jgi:F-type H+-transporting ATPase subunit delta